MDIHQRFKVNTREYSDKLEMKSDCIYLSVNEVTFEGCVLEGQRVGGKSGR